MQIRVNKDEFVKKLLAKRKRLQASLAKLKKTVDDHNKKVDSNRKKALDQAIKLLVSMQAGKIPAWTEDLRLGIRYRSINGDLGSYKAELEVPVKFTYDELQLDRSKNWRLYDYTRRHITAINSALNILKMATDETVVLSEKMGYNKLLTRLFDGFDTDPEGDDEE